MFVKFLRLKIFKSSFKILSLDNFLIPIKFNLIAFMVEDSKVL